MLIDGLVPVPAEVSRRAWNVAQWLNTEPSFDFRGDWLNLVLQADPERLMWSQCALLFGLERLHKERRP